MRAAGNEADTALAGYGAREVRITLRAADGGATRPMDPATIGRRGTYL